MSTEVWDVLVEQGAITDEMQRIYEAFDSSDSYRYEPDVTFNFDTETLTVVGTFEDREYQAEIRWRLADVLAKVEADGRWYRKGFRLCDFGLQKHQSIVDVDHCTVDDQWSDTIWLRSPAKVAKAVLLGDDAVLAHKSLSYLDKFPSYLPAKPDQWTACDDQEWRIVLVREPMPEIAQPPETPKIVGKMIRHRRRALDDRPSTPWDERVIYNSLAEAEAAVASAALHEYETLVIQTHRIVQRVTATGEPTLAWLDGHEWHEPRSLWIPVAEEARLWAEPEEVEEPDPEIPLSKVKLPTKGVPGHPGVYWRWERAKDGTSTMIIILRDGEGGWCVQATPTWTGNRSWDDIVSAGEIVEVRVPTKRAALEAAHERFGR